MNALTASDLGLVLAELRELLPGAEVSDVARLANRDDLLLFLTHDARKQALQVAPGGPRARLCLTKRRFAKEAFATGPLVDRLAARLRGLRWLGADHQAGERCCTLFFGGVADRAPVTLAVELFGPRGLWCLVDADGRIAELSRLPDVKDRELTPGKRYVAPRGRPALEAAPPRFAAPVNAAVDRHFTALDLDAEQGDLRTTLARAVGRAQRRLNDKIAGLERQLLEIQRAPQVRLHADMLLAYGFSLPRGAAELLAPHPERADETLRIPLDPSKPVKVQAEALYKEARKLEDSAGIAAQRLVETRAALEPLAVLAERLQQATDPSELEALADDLRHRGLESAPRQAAASSPAKTKKLIGGENLRRFRSAEGYAVLVGRTNQQNDKLTLRIARGNDLWLHVGQSYAGSHVVVRLPAGKTASLETLLDAGTLAIHFSKARGVPVCDVIYTFAKNVRKPKGLPAGAVVPSQTKTVRVRLEPDRLRRLLDSTDDDAEPNS